MLQRFVVAIVAVLVPASAWTETVSASQSPSSWSTTLPSGHPAPTRHEATPDPIKPKIQKSGLAVELAFVLRAPVTGRAGQPPAGLVQFEAAGDGSRRMFLADQNGVIWLVTNGALAAEPLLDLRRVRGEALITSYRQAGLRSFAFHPDFARPGRPGHRILYTATTETAASADRRTTVLKAWAVPVDFHGVVAEWRVDARHPDRVDPTSRREVLRIADPGPSHNIDLIAFNLVASPGESDHGKLYIGMGDGDSSRLLPDPYRQGQNTASPLAGILRIDPLSRGGAPYTVPSDNPFLGRPGIPAEKWAYGLRNPERFTWDPVSKRMVVIDIGQHNIEEVNLGRPGANYGWSLREGTFVTNPDAPARLFHLPPDDARHGFAYPVAQYDHDEGQAIMGGFVYRGSAIAELRGHYVFGDLVDGRVFHVPAKELDEGRLALVRELTLLNDGKPATLKALVCNPHRVDLRFGMDEDGELYLITKQDAGVRALRPANRRP